MRSSRSRNAAASPSSPPRSTAVSARRGTTARSGSSSSATSSKPGGARWCSSATTSSASTPPSSCRRRCGRRRPRRGFADPLVECLSCHQRFRADHLPEPPRAARTAAARASPSPGNFNLMFKTHMGPVPDEDNAVYLRPETAQGDVRGLRADPDVRAQEDPVRDRADRQVVPQRDHAGQLRVPHAGVRADGAGVLRASREADEDWHRVLDR